MFKQMAVVAVLGAAVAGCQSSESQAPAAPSSGLRQSVVTAPADLQLLCASEAATQLGVASSEVLPVSSGQTEAGQYRVQLTVGSGRASCLVTDQGDVISVARV